MSLFYQNGSELSAVFEKQIIEFCSCDVGNKSPEEMRNVRKESSDAENKGEV